MNPNSKIIFVVPQTIKYQSGGNLYNQQISRYLMESDFSVNYHRIPDGEHSSHSIGSTADILIVDSFLLTKLEVDQDQRMKILICHGPRDFSPLFCKKMNAYNHIVFVSKELAESAKSHLPQSIISPGMDHLPPTNNCRQSLTKKNRFINVGSIQPHKGQELIILALSLVDDKSWELNLVGETESHPNYVAELKKLIDRLDLNSQVRLLGELPHQRIADMLSCSSLYIASAPYESYGIAILEALQLNIPVVNCAEGAPRNYVKKDQGWQIEFQCPIILGYFLRRWVGCKILNIKPDRPKTETWKDSALKWEKLLSNVIG